MQAMRHLAHSGLVLIAFGLFGCGKDGNEGAAPSRRSEVTVEGDGVTASAYLRGDNLIVELESDEKIYALSCVETDSIWTRVGDDWVERRYQAPSGNFHQGFYRDDVYVEPTPGLGCDSVYCFETDGSRNLGPAVEVIEAGMRAAPEWLMNSIADDPAPVFESEPLSGPLRLRGHYWLDPQCQREKNVTLELEVPEEGVCCPVAEAGCSSEGGAGGWAISADDCQEHYGASGEYAERTTDARGCQVLRAIPMFSSDPRAQECVQP